MILQSKHVKYSVLQKEGGQTDCNMDRQDQHIRHYMYTRWRHQIETFSALLAICAGNSPAPGEFPTPRPVTRSFDVFFDLRLTKRLSKQS